jgi:hypothetical protein
LQGRKVTAEIEILELKKKVKTTTQKFFKGKNSYVSGEERDVSREGTR